MTKENWVDFKAIKSAVSMEMMIAVPEGKQPDQLSSYDFGALLPSL